MVRNEGCAGWIGGVIAAEGDLPDGLGGVEEGLEFVEGRPQAVRVRLQSAQSLHHLHRGGASRRRCIEPPVECFAQPKCVRTGGLWDDKLGRSGIWDNFGRSGPLKTCIPAPPTTPSEGVHNFWGDSYFVAPETPTS